MADNTTKKLKGAKFWGHPGEWTPERIVDIVKRKGEFSTGPRYRDDPLRRMARRLVDKGVLRARRGPGWGYTTFTLKEADNG